MRMMRVMLSILLAGSLAACSSVDVTKTAKGYQPPTNPNDVEILMTKPDKHFEELGTINATGFAPSDTAKMHNAVRAKAAPLGADAVIITGSGMVGNGWGAKQYAMGVAIHYNSDRK